MGAFLLPALAGGASLFSSIFGNKAKNDQARPRPTCITSGSSSTREPLRG